MNRNLLITSFILLLVSAAGLNGQARNFRWDYGLCEFSGTYDARKYSLQQLRDTLRLIEPGGFGITAWATVFHPNDLPNLSLQKLEDNYREQVNAVNSLDVVNVPYFQKLRQDTLEELRQVYELSKVTIEAHTDPKILRTYDGADSCKTKFAEPLIAGGDELLRTWRLVNEDSRSKNADPERLRREFEQQMASPDRMKFALVEVMGFGWWNCANETIFRVPTEGQQEREFKKLFTRVRTLGCG